MPKLEEITLKIASGSTPNGGKDNYKTEGISLVRSLNIHDFNFLYKNLAFIDYEQSKKLSNVIIEENDILLNITGASVGRCTMIPNDVLPARVNQHVMIIRPNIELVNPRYLLYLINSRYYKSKLMTLSETGATREALTKDDISSFDVDLPSIGVQNKVATILSNYDNLIENNYKRVKLLEGMTEDIYTEWFVRLRFPNYANTKIIDGVPDGWKESKIKSISNFINGFAFKSSDFQESGHSIIKIKNIGNHTVDITNSDKVSSDITKKLDIKYRINSGELLIAMTGATVGKLGFMPITKNKYYLNQRVGKIKSNYLLFIFLFLSSKVGQKYIDNIAAGAAQPNISADDIMNIRLLIPKQSILENFENKIIDFYSEIHNLQEANENLKETRDVLLPRLISGKLDIEALDIV